jgi:hypothetical protein
MGASAASRRDDDTDDAGSAAAADAASGTLATMIRLRIEGIFMGDLSSHRVF